MKYENLRNLPSPPSLSAAVISVTIPFRQNVIIFNYSPENDSMKMSPAPNFFTTFFIIINNSY